jgi:hypothetical protein
VRRVELIEPPFPAPYLDGVKSLPRSMRGAAVLHILRPEIEEAMQRRISKLTRLIRRKRREYERTNGVKINSEPPLVEFS